MSSIKLSSQDKARRCHMIIEEAHPDVELQVKSYV
jgi:hypothetical protein